MTINKSRQLNPKASSPSFKHTPIKRNALASLALVALILAGCGNSNSSESTQTGSNSTVNPTSSLDSNPANIIEIESNDDVVAALQANLTASGIEQTVLSASPTDMPGMYWVDAEGMPAFFTDEQGKFIIQGQIIEVGDAQPIDVSAQLQSQLAHNKLAQVSAQDMIIFPARGETKAAVYVFTDADCGYCRKLHSEMQDINNNGIEVRYLAWPRSPQTEPKMEAIWCSDDRNLAMNRAKAGENISASSCDNPVTEQVDLGFSLGVNGTPAIFTESGTKVGGYLPAAQLAQVAIANR